MNKNKRGKNEPGNKSQLSKTNTGQKPSMTELDKVLLTLTQQVTERLTELRLPLS